MSASPKVPESSLWDWLKKANLSFRELLHMTRIENTAGDGASDVEGVLDGGPFYVELKSAARPVRPGTPIKVRFEPSQPGWHEARRNAGRMTFVLLQVGAQHQARRYLVESTHIPAMAEGVTEQWLDEHAVIGALSSREEILVRASRSLYAP